MRLRRHLVCAFEGRAALAGLEGLLDFWRQVVPFHSPALLQRGARRAGRRRGALARTDKQRLVRIALGDDGELPGVLLGNRSCSCLTGGRIAGSRSVIPTTHLESGNRRSGA